MRRVPTPASTIAMRLTASWAIAPRHSRPVAERRGEADVGGGGIVVTEISTPTSAPDLAEVSESMPAAPAKPATMKEKASGWEMNWVSGCSALLEVVVDPAGRATQQGEQEGGGDPEREADRERRQRAHGDVAAALDDRDAEPGERAELGPDDHRADDQDRRVEEDPDRGDQAGEDHEGEEVAAELGVLRGARLDLLPDDRVGGQRRAAARSARSAASEICESICSIAIEPSRAIAELLQVADDHAGVLAGDVAEDHVARRLARRARQVDQVAGRRRRARAGRATCSERSAGATIRRWTIGQRIRA